MKNNKRGYLLPMVIIYMIIAMIVGAGIMVLGSLDRIEANKRLHREQAFYLAEAGINWAYYRLKNNPSENLTGPQNFGDVAFQISDTTTGDTRTIISTGTVKSGTVTKGEETVAINVTKGGGSKIFGQGIFGTERLEIQNSAYVDSYDSIQGTTDGYEGNVGSNTYIYIGNVVVRGDALCAGGDGSIVLHNQAQLLPAPGIANENAPLRILDPVPVVVPFNLPLTISPDLQINGGSINDAIYTLIGGVLTVKAKKTLNISGGDFHFTKINVEGTGGGATLNFTETVRIYVENSLTVGNASSIIFESASRSELYMGNPGSISMDNNSSIITPASTTCLGIYVVGIGPAVIRNNSSSNFYAVIYAPLATVQLFNGVELSGDIVANKIFLEEGAIVHYNTALQSLPLPPGDPGGTGPPRFLSWTKPDWKIK